MPNRVKDKIDRSNYYTRLAQVESSGNPNAKAKTSSAAGLYQFIESTWTGLVKEMGLNYSLEDRFDSKKARVVLDYFTNQNANYLKQKLGREPNEAELYIAHFGGMGTAGKLANLSADADIREMFNDSAIKANRAVFQTNKIENVKQFYDWAATKFDVPQGQRLYRDTEPKPVVKYANANISEVGQAQQTIDNTATNNNFKYTSAGWPKPVVKYANANISEVGQAQQTIDNTATNNNFKYTSAGWPNEKYLKNKEEGINENLTNLDITKQNTNFVLPFPVKEEKEQEEKDTDSKEVSQAKEILNKRKATRDFLTQLVQQHLTYEPVEYVRTNPYQGQPSQVMEDGGKVRITDVDGNEQLMDINSKEYRDLYNEGGIGVKTGENEYSMSLPGIEFSSKDREYPYYHTLSDAEKEYFDDKSPIGRAIRGKAVSGRTFNADDALGMAGNLLGATGSVLQTPQSMMVEGIEGMRGNEYNLRNALPHTGKQRAPSDAWGYENPEGFWQHASNIGMDIVADPSLVTGGGAMSRIPTSSGVINKLARKTVKEAGEKTAKKATSSVDDVGKGFGLKIDELSSPDIVKKSKDVGKNIDLGIGKFDHTNQVDYKNGLQLHTYSKPGSNVDDVILVFNPKTNENIAYMRNYKIGDDWKPAATNEWHIKADMPTADKDLIKFANKELEKIVQVKPTKFEGKTISTDGLRYWNQQQKHGYSPTSNSTTPSISPAGKDDLFKGLNYDKTDDAFEGLKFKTEKDASEGAARLTEFMKSQGLDYKVITGKDNSLKVQLPKLQRAFTTTGAVIGTGAATQMEDGGKVKIIGTDGVEREVEANSKEYRDLYNEGGIGVKTGENEYSMSLPAIEFSSKDKINSNIPGIPIKQRDDFSGNFLSGMASGNKRRDAYGKLGDLYRYFGGDDLKHDALEISHYQPTNSKDKDVKYIAIKDDTFIKEMLETYDRVFNRGELQEGTRHKEFKVNDNTYSVRAYHRNNETVANAIGQYFISRGEDDRGKYISYYDIFDRGTGKKDGFSFGATKPFEIYDRIYLDELPEGFKY